MKKREWIITDSLQKCKNQDVTQIDSLIEEYSCPHRKPSSTFLSSRTELNGPLFRTPTTKGILFSLRRPSAATNETEEDSGL